MNGAVVTAGEIREVLRGFGPPKPGAAPATAQDALDRIVDGRLFYEEGKRRGLPADPEVRGALAEYRRQTLVEEYVLWKYGDEVRVSPEAAAAATQEGFHGKKMSKEQWASVLTVARLKERIEKLQDEIGAGAKKEYFPDTYQKPNTTGRPHREFVVARIDGVDIRWGDVEGSIPSPRRKPPPLQGLDAMAFVKAIDKAAGTLRLEEEAATRSAEFSAAVERRLATYEQVLVARRLSKLEVEPKLNAGDKEARAKFAAQLRAAAKIVVDKKLLERITP